MRAGIAYFRAHKIDAAHNRESGKTKLSMPVLTVSGTASAGAEFEAEIRPLVKQIRAVVIENCGHYIAEEQPEQLIEELLGFLRKGTQDLDRLSADSTTEQTILQD